MQSAQGPEGNGLCFRHNSRALHCEEELLGNMMAAWLCILPAPYLDTEREDGQNLDLTSLGDNMSQKLHTTSA